MKTTVLITCSLMLIGVGSGALTTRLDRVAAQSVKIEPGRKPTPKPAAPTPTPRNPVVNRTPRRAAPVIEMVLVPGGTLLMGSPENEPGRSEDEGPRRVVTVRSFQIGKYEVTQAQWRAVMGGNPSSFKGDDLPVVNVSWNNAKEYCRRLSEMTGAEYRLPTEAEWEYACRAMTSGLFLRQRDAYAGDLDAMAWYDKNSLLKLHPVGQKAPNAFGIYDMHGNVSEWCEDDWHDNYANAPKDANAWVDKPSRGSLRLCRGGGWDLDAGYCRSADRTPISPGYSAGDLGFRLVRTYR